MYPDNTTFTNYLNPGIVSGISSGSAVGAATSLVRSATGRSSFVMGQEEGCWCYSPCEGSLKVGAVYFALPGYRYHLCGFRLPFGVPGHVLLGKNGVRFS